MTPYGQRPRWATRFTPCRSLARLLKLKRLRGDYKRTRLRTPLGPAAEVVGLTHQRVLLLLLSEPHHLLCEGGVCDGTPHTTA